MFALQNDKMLTFSGFSCVLRAETIFPAELNNLSQETLEGGGHKNLEAISAKHLNRKSFFFYPQ